MIFKRDCPQCNKELTYKTKLGYNRRNDGNKVCRSCSKIGKILSPEHKAKISDGLNNSQKFKDGMKRATDSGIFKGKNNGFYGKIHSDRTLNILREKCGREGEDNGFYGKNHTVESRASMSLTRSNKIASGELQIYAKNGGYYKSIKTGITEHYDSYLELLRMQQMDNDNYNSNWTKKHKIRIGYAYNSLKYNYVPDFLVTYISGDISIDEVKGYDQRSKVKLEALKTYAIDNSIKYNWYWMDDPIFNNYKTWMKTKQI